MQSEELQSQMLQMLQPTLQENTEDNELFLTLAMEAMYKEQHEAMKVEKEEIGEKEQALFELYLAHYQREAHEKALHFQMQQEMTSAAQQLLTQQLNQSQQLGLSENGSPITAGAMGLFDPSFDLASFILQQQAALELASAGLNPEMKAALASLNFGFLGRKPPSRLSLLNLSKGPQICKECGKE